jgi:putative membrane protein
MICSWAETPTGKKPPTSGTRRERRRPVDFGHELRVFITAIIYAFAGMALLLVGYRIFDWMTPTDLQEKVFKDGNVAVAVVVGFFMLGVAVVIHGAFST